jgi:hypothetical protein
MFWLPGLHALTQPCSQTLSAPSVRPHHTPWHVHACSECPRGSSFTFAPDGSLKPRHPCHPSAPPTGFHQQQAPSLGRTVRVLMQLCWEAAAHEHHPQQTYQAECACTTCWMATKRGLLYALMHTWSALSMRMSLLTHARTHTHTASVPPLSLSLTATLLLLTHTQPSPPSPLTHCRLKTWWSPSPSTPEGSPPSTSAPPAPAAAPQEPISLKSDADVVAFLGYVGRAMGCSKVALRIVGAPPPPADALALRATTR